MMPLEAGNMRVCCVIVTYGDRFTLVSQVVNKVLDMGIAKVIIVDNGSAEHSAARLDHFITDKPAVTVFRFAANEGSAGGFKKGIEIARKEDCPFIWLLDDDNLPENGAMQRLRLEYDHVLAGGSLPDEFALACMRIDRLEFHRVLQKGVPDAILPPLNAYMGFHLKEVALKVKERIVRKSKAAPVVKDAPMQVRASTYGGLFFHKSLPDKVGLPDETFVLYADDFDFTLRITKQGGKIWLLPDSVVHDIDQSFYLPPAKKFLYHSSLDTGSDTLVYYVIRNAVYVGKRYLVTSKWVYGLNKVMFTVIITLLAGIRGKFKRLGLIYTAMREGAQGKLGMNSRYKL